MKKIIAAALVAAGSLAVAGSASAVPLLWDLWLDGVGNYCQVFTCSF